MLLHTYHFIAVPQVVAQHLFQEGRFAVGEAFLREAKLPYGEKLKAPFAAMHSVLQSVRNLPSLRIVWVACIRQSARFPKVIVLTNKTQRPLVRKGLDTQFNFYVLWTWQQLVFLRRSRHVT